MNSSHDPTPPSEELAAACRVITQVLHEFFKSQTITAQEFLSIVSQLPVRPVDRRL